MHKQIKREKKKQLFTKLAQTKAAEKKTKLLRTFCALSTFSNFDMVFFFFFFFFSDPF